MLSRRIEFSRIFLSIPIGGNVSIIPRSWRQFSTLYVIHFSTGLPMFLSSPLPSLLPHYSRKYSNGVLRRVFHGGKRIWVQLRQNVRSVFLSCDEKHNRIFPFSFVFNVNPRPTIFAQQRKKKKKKKNQIRVHDSLLLPPLSRKEKRIEYRFKEI